MSLAIDCAVLFIYFFGIVGIGLWAGRRNRNLKDFALGGRSIPWWAVLASIVAAETSAVTFLGTPGEGYTTQGYVYGQLAIGTILARIIVAFTFIKPYYRYRVESVYEFLDVRFGQWTRNAASAIFLVTRVLGIGVRLYLGGVFLVVIWRYLLNHPKISLATYFWGIVFVTLITTVYTAFGGIKAVVWTDVIQTVLMMGSMIAAMVLLGHRIPGGLSGVRETMGGFGSIRVFETGFHPGQTAMQTFFRVLVDPYTIFGALIGSTFLTM